MDDVKSELKHSKKKADDQSSLTGKKTKRMHK